MTKKETFHGVPGILQYPRNSDLKKRRGQNVVIGDTKEYVDAIKRMNPSGPEQGGLYLI